MDLRYRSLLQNAVRRGADNLVITSSALLESIGPKEKNWLRKRTVVIALEECWPLGTELIFTKSFHSRVAALVKAARAIKDKGAAGLGALAFALSKGDRSVMTGSPEDKHIRIIAKAIQRPDDFWKWVEEQEVGVHEKTLIQNAARFKNIGRPHERTVTKAAAYLAATRECPGISLSAVRQREFPYWIVFDKHTRQGKRVLHDIARDLHIPVAQLEWTFFYFEGGATGNAPPSKWWERMCLWRFQKVGIPAGEAHLLWEPAKPQLTEALAEDGHILHKDVYKWKMAHRESVETLKKKVELYIANFNDIHQEQMKLF